jgi:hypothetical protein
MVMVEEVLLSNGFSHQRSAVYHPTGTMSATGQRSAKASHLEVRRVDKVDQLPANLN